jgi:2,3-dihydroxyphenylpropionate 1,2-dioxygenase
VLAPVGIVAGAAVPHAPQFFTLPDTEDHDQVARVRSTMQAIGEVIRASELDALVIVANDHLDNFLLAASPPFTVLRGPVARGSFAGVDYEWVVDSDSALELIIELQDLGFDPTVSLNVPIGYEFGIPLTFLGIPRSFPVIPVFVNSYVAPQPSPDRCYAFGRALQRAARSAGKRLGIIASGGLSHFPGTDQYAAPDVDTDRELLAAIEVGNLRTLLRYDAMGLDRIGNVEARSWIILAGALGERRPDGVAMEPSWHHTYAMAWWSPPGAATESQLHYPVPRASQLRLYEALYELRMSRDAALAHLDDAVAFAARFELAPAEREAIVTLDDRQIKALGVHPLLGFLARLQLDNVRKSLREGA